MYKLSVYISSGALSSAFESSLIQPNIGAKAKQDASRTRRHRRPKNRRSWAAAQHRPLWQGCYNWTHQQIKKGMSDRYFMIVMVFRSFSIQVRWFHKISYRSVAPVSAVPRQVWCLASSKGDHVSPVLARSASARWEKKIWESRPSFQGVFCHFVHLQGACLYSWNRGTKLKITICGSQM